MIVYYAGTFFIFGILFGSFYNVVGFRLPNKESLIHPGSHCPKCNHKLTPIELIPIISFLIQGTKCKNCRTKISWFYPIFEFITGILFMVSYLVFGFSLELVIALTFISMLVIIVISDYHYMIIPDEVLIVSLILLIIEVGILNGITGVLSGLLNGLIAFLIMWGIKLLGDKLFKKESMGGGDIKLMFLIGFVLGWQMALVSIFIGSLIGLPVSLIVLKKKKTNIIPFGPFISLGAVIIFLTQLDFKWIIDIMTIK